MSFSCWLICIRTPPRVRIVKNQWYVWPLGHRATLLWTPELCVFLSYLCGSIFGCVSGVKLVIGFLLTPTSVPSISTSMSQLLSLNSMVVQEWIMLLSPLCYLVHRLKKKRLVQSTTARWSPFCHLDPLWGTRFTESHVPNLRNLHLF